MNKKQNKIETKSVDVYLTISPNKFDKDEHFLNQRMLSGPIYRNSRSDVAILYYAGRPCDVDLLIKSIETSYKEVIVMRLPDEISSDVTKFENEISKKYLNEFLKGDKEFHYEVKSIFVYKTRNFNKNLSSKENSEELAEKLQFKNVEIWKGDTSITFAVMGILNFFVTTFKCKIHYIIDDPDEVDISSYIHEGLEFCITRHFHEHLDDRNNLIQNQTFVYYFEKFGKVKPSKNKEFSLIVNDIGNKIDKLIYEDVKNICQDIEKFDVYLIDEIKRSNKIIDESLVTLLYPKNNSIVFPLVDFVYSILNDCLPIIIDIDYFKTFIGDKQMIDLIEKYLYLNQLTDDHLITRVKLLKKDHTEIIEEFKKSNYFTQNVFDRFNNQKKIDVFFN